MLALDANLWVSAFEPVDPFHDDSVAVFRTAAELGLPLAGPAYVVLESVGALARRLNDSAMARVAGAKMNEHPALHLAVRRAP